MLEFGLVVLVGLIGGFAVGVQSPIAGAMGSRVGGTSSSFIIHLSGAILSGGLLLLRGGENIKDWQSLPWYMLWGGLFGVILYQTISITMPRLGVTMTVALIIIGQLLVGTVIDHFGWLGVVQRSVDATRLLGIAALILGGYLIAK